MLKLVPNVLPMVLVCASACAKKPPTAGPSDVERPAARTSAGCEGDWSMEISLGSGTCEESDVVSGKFVLRVVKTADGFEIAELPDDMESLDLLGALNGFPRLVDAKSSADGCEISVVGVNEDRIAPGDFRLKLSLRDRDGNSSGSGTFEVEPREDPELPPPAPCTHALDVSVAR